MCTTVIRRLTEADAPAARQLFALMADVFQEETRPLSDAYVQRLLRQGEFWAVGAFVDDEVVGGLTAHALPMTTGESFELFIYDIAVRADRQRQGIGRSLIGGLREMAAATGIDVVFVPADDDDAGALEFYRALDASALPVTLFVFSPSGDD
jgi:aminoglycoside 3-N-acetyltransferase I